jgi:hypothetical protein
MLKNQYISAYEAISNERYACQRMIDCYWMQEDVKLMSERLGVNEGFDYRSNMIRKQKMNQK